MSQSPIVLDWGTQLLPWKGPTNGHHTPGAGAGAAAAAAQKRDQDDPNSSSLSRSLPFFSPYLLCIYPSMVAIESIVPLSVRITFVDRAQEGS